MSRVIASFFILVTVAASAQERYLLRPSVPLNDGDRRALASSGAIIERVLANGVYLVRTEEKSSIEGLEPLTPELKIHRSVYRETARGLPLIRLSVLFHAGIPFDEARESIAAVGGTLEDPLALGFGYMHQLTVLLPRGSHEVLAGDERVFMIAGAPLLRIEPDNWKSAALSHVTELHESSYDLTGRGVVISQFEGGEAHAGHAEFEGRVTTHFTSELSKNHPTHVAGTMIAAGLSPYAKGMAPEAILHQFHASSANEDWQIAKDLELDVRGIVADNNSWSYVVGWTYQTGGFAWNGREELWGSYDLVRTASIDKLARERRVLFVHSAGNDADNPDNNPWFFHRHLGSDGNPDLEINWCYSRNGTGRDCPQPQCTKGPSYCETTTHHPLSPYDTMSMTASAKNVVAVGSVDDEKAIAPYSSRGPAKDGRVKPDLVARGSDVISTIHSGSPYAISSGTSMAAPVVTGTAALLTEQWRRTRSEENPGPDVLKALLIAGAEDLGPVGPDYTFGFGLLNAQASVDFIRKQDLVHQFALAQGDRIVYSLPLEESQNVRVVLQWLDPEAIFTGADPPDAKALVNDLDLRILDPRGAELWPWVLDPSVPEMPAARGINDTDNTEIVEFTAPSSGTYRVIVTASRIADVSPQEAVIVSTSPVFRQDPLPRRRAVRR